MVAATASSRTLSLSSSQRPAGGKTQQQSASNHNDDIFIRTSWADAAEALAQIDKVSCIQPTPPQHSSVPGFPTLYLLMKLFGLNDPFLSFAMHATCPASVSIMLTSGSYTFLPSCVRYLAVVRRTRTEC
jgi:hypothetical protein